MVSLKRLGGGWGECLSNFCVCLFTGVRASSCVWLGRTTVGQCIISRCTNTVQYTNTNTNTVHYMKMHKYPHYSTLFHRSTHKCAILFNAQNNHIRLQSSGKHCTFAVKLMGRDDSDRFDYICIHQMICTCI